MILYIDTSNSKKTVVGLRKGKKKIVLEGKSTKYKSQNVLLLIDQLLKKENARVGDLKEIQVNSGPGSFTGLRVGISVANTLSWALKVPVNGKRPPVDPIYSSSKFDY